MGATKGTQVTRLKDHTTAPRGSKLNFHLLPGDVLRSFSARTQDS